jgi:hypothetical protein
VSILVQRRSGPLASLPGGCGFQSSFWSLFTVTLVKSVYASCRVDQFLLASKKRVASRADFHMKVALPRGTGLKSLAAGAGHSYLVICGMNLWLHYSLIPS